MMMGTLEERLRRLGQHVEVELEARASVDHARAIGRPESRLRVIHGEHGDTSSVGIPRRRLPRMSAAMLTAAAVVAVVAAGLVAISSRGSDHPEASDPTSVGTAAPAQQSAVAASPSLALGADPTSTDAEPASSGDYGPYHWTDADLLTRVYTLLDVGTPEEVTEAFTAEVSQNEIAACMGEAGFQYEPDDPLSGDPRWTMSPEDYAAQYGLGILAQVLGDYPSAGDPNQAYVNSLSDGQRAAYYSARDMCTGGGLGTGDLAFFDAYQVAFEQFRVVVAADVRVADATEAWSACMAAAGFSYEDSLQMRSTFWDAMSLSGEEQEQRFNDEIAVAVANVPCEAAYLTAYRDVVADRFDEFKDLLQSALETGAAPEAQGMR